MQTQSVRIDVALCMNFHQGVFSSELDIHNEVNKMILSLRIGQPLSPANPSCCNVTGAGINCMCGSGTRVLLKRCN